MSSTVVGHVKTCSIVALGWAYSGRKATDEGIYGIIMAIAGILAYVAVHGGRPLPLEELMILVIPDTRASCTGTSNSKGSLELSGPMPVTNHSIEGEQISRCIERVFWCRGATCGTLHLVEKHPREAVKQLWYSCFLYGVLKSWRLYRTENCGQLTFVKLLVKLLAIPWTPERCAMTLTLP